MYCRTERNFFRFFFKENDIQKIFLAISKKMTSRHEATALGIHLGINHDDVTYHVTNYDVRDAAYTFLCWAGENYGPAEKWEKITEALKALDKNTTIRELGLKERLTDAKQKMPVQIACVETGARNSNK